MRGDRGSEEGGSEEEREGERESDVPLRWTQTSLAPVAGG